MEDNFRHTTLRPPTLYSQCHEIGNKSGFLPTQDGIHLETMFGEVLVYIDDIIIFSRTLEDHVEHLNQVLGALANSGRTLLSCCVEHQSFEAAQSHLHSLLSMIHQLK